MVSTGRRPPRGAGAQRRHGMAAGWLQGVALGAYRAYVATELVTVSFCAYTEPVGE